MPSTTARYLSYKVLVINIQICYLTNKSQNPKQNKNLKSFVYRQFFFTFFGHYLAPPELNFSGSLHFFRKICQSYTQETNEGSNYRLLRQGLNHIRSNEKRRNSPNGTKLKKNKKICDQVEFRTTNDLANIQFTNYILICYTLHLNSLKSAYNNIEH